MGSRQAEQQPPRVVDDARLLTATALAVEDEPVYTTLNTVLVVWESIEVEAKKTLAVTFAQTTQATWEQVLEEALLMMRMRTRW